VRYCQSRSIGAATTRSPNEATVVPACRTSGPAHQTGHLLNTRRRPVGDGWAVSTDAHERGPNGIDRGELVDESVGQFRDGLHAVHLRSQRSVPRINGCIVSRMPKMQVYLPDELYEKIKSQTARLNVSGILQAALAQRLDQLERQDALAAAVDSYTGEFGVFSDEELNRQAEADRKQTVRPRTKKKASSAA
jgi:post-segregation antitoxin (ccd killing protein)